MSKQLVQVGVVIEFFDTSGDLREPAEIEQIVKDYLVWALTDPEVTDLEVHVTAHTENVA